MPKPQMMPRASLRPLSPALAPAMSKTKMARCANPLAYWPVYTGLTPKGKNPARIPATVGLGPLLLPGGGGGGATCPGVGLAAGTVPGTNPAAPVGTPSVSILAPRQSSQSITPRTGRVQFAHSAFPQVRQ